MFNLRNIVCFVFLFSFGNYRPTEGRVQLDFEYLKTKFPFNLANVDSYDELLENNVKYKTKEDLPNYQSIMAILESEKEDRPIVKIPEFGAAAGRTLKTIYGNDFFAFHSIPYALPPNETYRFQMPRPWKGEWEKDLDNQFFDATFLRAKCPQISLITSAPAGREDCLHISVYTPTTFKENASYPVMFFIHGGAFTSGDASLYVPTKLMEKDVVVVVVQYRLGTLGFLAAETPENPGNMGLMDIITALRWVQKYIKYFGGDSNLVTVFGQSAGSACTSWLQFTKLVNAENNGGEPLIHRIITQSGTALDVWASDPDPKGSFELEAEEVGCWDESKRDPITAALKCMQDLPLSDIVYGFNNIYIKDRKEGGLGIRGSAPILQKNLKNNFQSEVRRNEDLLVLEEDPIKLLQSGDFLKVPVMAGAVRDEGSVFLGYIYKEFLIPNNLTENTTFLSHLFVPDIVQDLKVQDTTGAVTNSLKISFLKDAQFGNFTSMSPGLVDMVGMVVMKSGVWQMAHYQTFENPDDPYYFYSFEMDSDDTLYDWFFMGENFEIEAGIAHGDELIYLFYLPSFLDKRELSTSNKLVTLWTNFAKYGNPTPEEHEQPQEKWDDQVPEWTSFSLTGLEYMLIKDNFTVESDFKSRWNYNTN